MTQMKQIRELVSTTLRQECFSQEEIRSVLEHIHTLTEPIVSKDLEEWIKLVTVYPELGGVRIGLVTRILSLMML